MNKWGETGQPPRVIIQQNSIPHYRARIFELLSQSAGVHFAVIADTESDTPFLKTLNGSEGRQIRYVHGRTRLIKIPGLPAFSWQPLALKMMWRERPDVLIVMGSPYSITAWLLGLMGKIKRTPVLMWGHGLLRNESGPKWWIRGLLYRLAAGQLLYGEYAKKLLVGKGFNPDSLYVIYNSLDYDLQQEIAAKIDEEDILAWRRSLGVKPAEGVVVFTGRLQPVKRLDLLVRAAGKLASRGKRIHLALVGDGSERRNLEQLSENLGIADLVHFLGSNYDEYFLGLVLSSSDLSVIPSGAGLSVMHAMVFGTPVLIHDRIECHFPEWEAVEDGVSGFYYKYEDVNDMAAKIERAIFPVPLKSSMAGNCKRVIRERYNPHYQATIIVQAVMKSLACQGNY